mmetsp:Transcript_119779/g.344246  ORF Transcript_119779/g.344246 Transcript_119779/m.344246 type:complete len:261 (+) Transcript_119779:75-857(+)|eukprot:CAMPEP_0170265880 /NCGR_PEP_ID=MMETSP0116_2-20130129/32848_1 /TAXON_ID=400756 /ORGANISM="Durinskia baltica, Strain CSIRO CS-38" /LENGTH=260 /DNA_ID=CAMNT_0010516999 /DNA_START=57 /DNA_END=839 /DNA_ORIENTATION=+
MIHIAAALAATVAASCAAQARGLKAFEQDTWKQESALHPEEAPRHAALLQLRSLPICRDTLQPSEYALALASLADKRIADAIYEGADDDARCGDASVERVFEALAQWEPRSHFGDLEAVRRSLESMCTRDTDTMLDMVAAAEERHRQVLETLVPAYCDQAPEGKAGMASEAERLLAECSVPFRSGAAADDLEDMCGEAPMLGGYLDTGMDAWGDDPDDDDWDEDEQDDGKEEGFDLDEDSDDELDGDGEESLAQRSMRPG